MKVKVIIHEVPKGGYWAEVPAFPGCFSQGETKKEILANIREAIACHLDVPAKRPAGKAYVEEIDL
jgi:predicted RNase H-like HicB family nuclease